MVNAVAIKLIFQPLAKIAANKASCCNLVI
ncbi:Uncharacterised protein [Mycobacteroides abscessus subsp. abscessus]|nr:Uncharacterised protein [Mycobacteroides abscessus subsp. abscessus]